MSAAMPSKAFEIVDEGVVARRDPRAPWPVAVGPRACVLGDGSLLCGYSVQTAVGSNDFAVTLSRSSDGGRSWQNAGSVWPHLEATQSIAANVSRSPDGELFLYGIAIPIDEPGESFWSDATRGIKQNELVWARSSDDGRTWTDPQVIPRDMPGSVEAPGPLCVTRAGRWFGCYAPYPTFDPMPQLDRQQIVAVSSADRGGQWTCQSALRFDEADSTGAEAWVVELSDGRLAAACWHMSGGTEGASANVDYPNKFALSSDGGLTWGPTTSTGTMGQSPGLAPLADGRLLMAYNQRRQEPAGVRLALATPTPTDFGLQADELVWQASRATRSDSAGDHSEWTDFAFGEPAPLPLPDGSVLVVFWCVQPDGRGAERPGVGYVRVAMEP